MTQNLPFKFTAHALERLKARGILPEELQELILHGVRSFDVRGHPDSKAVYIFRFNNKYREDKFEHLKKQGVDTERLRRLVAIISVEGHRLLTAYYCTKHRRSKMYNNNKRRSRIKSRKEVRKAWNRANKGPSRKMD